MKWQSLFAEDSAWAQRMGWISLHSKRFFGGLDHDTGTRDKDSIRIDPTINGCLPEKTSQLNLTMTFVWVCLFIYYYLIIKIVLIANRSVLKFFRKTTANRPLWTKENRFKLTFRMLFSSFVVYIFIHIYCFMNKCSLIFVWKRHKPFREPFFRLIFSCVLFADLNDVKMMIP